MIERMIGRATLPDPGEQIFARAEELLRRIRDRQIQLTSEAQGELIVGFTRTTAEPAGAGE